MQCRTNKRATWAAQLAADAGLEHCLIYKQVIMHLIFFGYSASHVGQSEHDMRLVYAPPLPLLPSLGQFQVLCNYGRQSPFSGYYISHAVAMLPILGTISVIHMS